MFSVVFGIWMVWGCILLNDVLKFSVVLVLCLVMVVIMGCIVGSMVFILVLLCGRVVCSLVVVNLVFCKLIWVSMGGGVVM